MIGRDWHHLPSPLASDLVGNAKRDRAHVSRSRVLFRAAVQPVRHNGADNGRDRAFLEEEDINKLRASARNNSPCLLFR